jgi:hypothetical protein
MSVCEPPPTLDRRGTACRARPRARPVLAVLVCLLSAPPVRAQPDPLPGPVGEPVVPASLQLSDPLVGSSAGTNAEPGQPSRSGLSPALQATVEALGASSGVPDGAGYTWYPTVPVRGQSARMGLSNYQVGGTGPVSAADGGGWYANGAARLLTVRTTAQLPSDKLPFPDQFWDVQAGGSYLRQFENGWSAGALLNFGTASDRPFHSLHEATVSALAFVRMPDGDRNGWLFCVVSTTTGQIGHNIPIPGLAYEYVSDRLHAVVGFPFVTIDYHPTDEIQFEFAYAAITDVLTRATYHLTPAARVYVGYEWTNQSWFRAARVRHFDQLFLYEMHAECGVGWTTSNRLDLRVAGGYAFNRFFVENGGFGLSGRNLVNLAPGPYLTAQLEFKF